MKIYLFYCFVPLIAMFFGVFAACGDEPTASGSAKSATVFPIVLNSGAPIAGVPADMPKNIAEMVGLMLERGGMKEIEIADVKFTPHEDADMAKTAEAFGRFVKSREIKTEYAVFGQFIGAVGQGVDEIRLVVADRQGAVLLAKQMDRKQLLSECSLGKEEKICPMSAAYCMFRQLQGFWGLANPDRKDAPEGKMAKLWAENTGGPSQSEKEAVESRLIALKKKIGSCSVTVYPSGGDAAVATRLAEMLAKANLFRAEAAGVDPKLQVKGGTNQARVLWDTARAFQDYLRKNPPPTDYALFASYGIGRSADGKSMVGGVNFVLCDRNADWVLVELRNSHWADFQRIDPKSPDDCNRLAVELLTDRLR